MKLLFIASYHYPSFIAQFRHGLIMAQNYSKILKDDFLYLVLFGDKKNLAEINFQEINKLRLPLRRWRLITVFFFFWLGWFFLFKKKWRGRQAVAITQESKIAFILLFLKKIFKFFVVYECHGLHSPMTDKYVLEKSDYLIFVNKLTLKRAQEIAGRKLEALVLPNAVAMENFEKAKFKKNKLRSELGLPEDKVLIGFVGRFIAMGADKGIKNCLLALKETADKNYLLCLVGGKNEEIAYFKKIAEELEIANRAIFVPYQLEQSRLAEYMVAMDALIYLPPPEKFFTEETSPMKLFEYMAAQKPIIVSDFPSIREILNEGSAVFVDPLNSQKVAEAVCEVINNCDLSNHLASNAFRQVLNNSWEQRTFSIIDIAEKLIKEPSVR